MTAVHSTVELGTIGLERGGYLLVKRALARAPVGGRVAVRGRDAALAIHLGAWCRVHGHRLVKDEGSHGGEAQLIVERGSAEASRWTGAEECGEPDQVVDRAPGTWGLAARGATIEAGGPHFHFNLSERRQVWAEEAARLYAQAAAAQWDPATAIPWHTPFELADELEDAVVQVMTYLIENETAALIVPARFAGQVHPHFREIVQLLAIQAADEARHIEVFTRRALLRRARPALSTTGGQASLKTLIDEPDFALASFLLSVLGEGSFLALLWFLHQHAPDPVTREIARLTAQDEARHVAFGLAHLTRHVSEEPGLLERLAMAIERRHDSLAHTAGLNQEVFDALIILAAGSIEPDAVARGFDAVAGLAGEMDQGRKKRLVRLGFEPDRAARLSSLHTRNFM